MVELDPGRENHEQDLQEWIVWGGGEVLGRRRCRTFHGERELGEGRHVSQTMGKGNGSTGAAAWGGKRGGKKPGRFFILTLFNLIF
jgi:hypothetical protein